jgi:predicted AAA+ superfamily ATPase
MFWRSHSGYEVDFVVGHSAAIEVKATKRVTTRDLRGLQALAEEVPLQQRLVVSMEPRERVTDEGVRVLPVLTFLEQLWADEIIR